MEEVETLNEELQATNEELETLNEELQATVEELNTTNDDMSARTVELTKLTEKVEQQHEASNAERVRLAAVLRSMRDALVAVGPDGTELLRNPAFDRFAAQHDVLLEEDGAPGARPAIPALLERASHGETFTAQLRATDDDGQRRWLEAVGQPFTERDQGGLLVIRDITERSLRRLQEEFVAILAHELRTPLTAIQGYLQSPRRQPRGRRTLRTAVTGAVGADARAHRRPLRHRADRDGRDDLRL